MEVKKGSKVHVEYEGKFPGGEVFDSTEKHGGEPLVFVAGEGNVVKGFDNALVGMKEGEEKEVTLTPEEGYGQPDPRGVQQVPREKLPEGAKEGMDIGVPLSDGQMIPAKITKIEDNNVTIDLNHPLAGKDLVFKIKLVKVEEN